VNLGELGTALLELGGNGRHLAIKLCEDGRDFLAHNLLSCSCQFLNHHLSLKTRTLTCSDSAVTSLAEATMTGSLTRVSSLNISESD